MLTLRYLTKNKKRTFITVLSVTLASVLLFCIGLLFSSAREYLIDEVKNTKGDYHVKIETTNNITSESFKAVKDKNGLLITYNDITKVYKLTDELCSSIKCDNVEYNDALLSLYGLSKKENIMQTFTSLLITFISILSIGIMVIIHNAFSISVIERKKQFGILKSIGMTQSKIKNMVLLESFIVLLLGIIIGFILSVIIMIFLIIILNNLLSELFVEKLTLVFYMKFVIIPVVFMTLIVLISAYLPAIRAGRFSIIDNIKGTDNYKVKKKMNLDKKDITFYLAYHNYKRNKKRYRPVIFCIFISTILFVSFSLYLNYAVDSLNKYSSIPDYDTEVHVNGSSKNHLEDFALENKATKYSVFENCIVPVKIEKDFYEADALKYYKEETNLLVMSGSEDRIINRIKQIENKDNKMKKVDISYLKDDVILNNQKIKTTNQIPFGVDNLLNSNNIVMITTDIDDYCPSRVTTLLMKGNIDNLKNKLEEFSKKHVIEDIAYTDVHKASLLTKNIIITIKVVLYGVLLLIILTIITSIVNVISASMGLRTKEFGTLFSIGLSNGQWKNLVFYETLFIVIKGFLLTLPFIVLIDYLLYQSLIEVFESTLIIPFDEMIISLIVSILVIYFTLYVMHKKMLKMAIITMLNSDNV